MRRKAAVANDRWSRSARLCGTGGRTSALPAKPVATRSCWAASAATGTELMAFPIVSTAGRSGRGLDNGAATVERTDRECHRRCDQHDVHRDLAAVSWPNHVDVLDIL